MQITSPDWSLARRRSHKNHIARLVTCSSPKPCKSRRQIGKPPQTIPCKSHRQIGKLPPLDQPLRFLAGTPMPSNADGVQCWPRNACQKKTTIISALVRGCRSIFIHTYCSCSPVLPKGVYVLRSASFCTGVGGWHGFPCSHARVAASIK